MAMSRTAMACRNYRASRPDSCEVAYLIPVSMNGPLEVHHILGRGRKPEYDSFSNLILVRTNAHQWGHDRHPARFEIACLWSKLKRAQKMVDGAKEYFDPSVLDAICDDGGLLGRVHGILLPKVIGSVFEPMAEELINELAKD